MANVYVEEESFLSHVQRVRGQVKTKFMRAHEILQNREADLLAKLERLVDDYTGDGIAQQINVLLESKDALSNENDENEEFLEHQLSSIDARITELQTLLRTSKDTYKSVSLEWGDELERKLSVAGEIRLNAVKEVIRDYMEIGDPVVTFGKHSVESSSPGLFRYPGGIAINPVNNSVYFCDGENDRVQVYSESFEFNFLFSEKMGIPSGICIKQNKVYVTQYSSNCLNVYSTEGKYVNSVGKKGKKELEFNGLRGLDISTAKNRIYIAEFGNDRVQCLNLDLKFNSFIDIFGARDVKLTSDEIVVLSSRYFCVSLYTYSHQLICEMISSGECNPVLIPSYLILDKSLNILITDFGRHCVSVFSFGGELIHRFGKEGEKRGEFKLSRGIILDAKGRIIVASYNREHCIQVF